MFAQANGDRSSIRPDSAAFQCHGNAMTKVGTDFLVALSTSTPTLTYGTKLPLFTGELLSGSIYFISIYISAGHHRKN